MIQCLSEIQTGLGVLYVYLLNLTALSRGDTWRCVETALTLQLRGGLLLASRGRRGAAQTPRVFGMAPPNTD